MESGFEGAVEIDPRTCSREFLKVLAAYEFDRISLGVQDFDVEVQKAINRVQPYDLVEKVLREAKRAGPFPSEPRLNMGASASEREDH